MSRFLWAFPLAYPATGCAELAAACHSSRFPDLAAFEVTGARLPFPVVSVHTHNGLDLMDTHFLRPCPERVIASRRSRGLKKPRRGVEYGPVGRCLRAYVRYGKDWAFSLMRAPSAAANTLVNLSLPSEKLVGKARYAGPSFKKIDSSFRSTS